MKKAASKKQDKPEEKKKEKPVIVKRISEALKRKRPAKKIENERGGVDDDLHMVLALQISDMEEKRRREEVNTEDQNVIVEAFPNFDIGEPEETDDISQVLETPLIVKKRMLETNKADAAILDSDADSSFPDSPLFASTKNCAPGTKFLSSSHGSPATLTSSSGFPAPNATHPFQSSISAAALTGRKMLKINDFTVTEHPEKAVLNMSNLSEKCQGRKKQMKSLKYGKPESESDEDLDFSKVTRRRLEKANIKPFLVKEAMDKGTKIFTPVNLQIVGWNWDEKSEELELSMSDSRFIYPMLLSSQFAWMIGSELKTNTILTITELKKKRGTGKLIIMHMMINAKIQVQHTLGNPEKL